MVFIVRREESADKERVLSRGRQDKDGSRIHFLIFVSQLVSLCYNQVRYDSVNRHDIGHIGPVENRIRAPYERLMESVR